MTTKTEIEAAALSLLGTPFAANQRAPGVGMDCIGVLVCVARLCGIPHIDRVDYPMQPNGELQQELAARFERVTGEPQVGDVLMMQLERMSEPHHVAILVSGDRIVHAHNRAGKTVAQTYTRFWHQAVRAVYRFPGVQ